MAYSFTEATFLAAVLDRIDLELGVIPNTITREAIRRCFVGLVEEIADELELIDAVI